MVRKIAVPVVNGKVSRSFERSRDFMLFTIGEKDVIELELKSTLLQPEYFPFWIAGLGVTDLIARNIISSSIRKLNQYKINVFVGVKSTDPESLVKDYLQGTLETSDIVGEGIPLLSG
ncbi:MAG: NifB/NifX family molybdenum-iron cluster-binding protein [bacterium]